QDHVGTSAMKRSASALNEIPSRWDVTPPMIAPTRSSLRLPFAHYAMVYLDDEGVLQVEESPSIKEQNSTVFTPDVRHHFLEILGETSSYYQSFTSPTLESSPRRVRRRQGNAPSSSVSKESLSKQSFDGDDYSHGSTNMAPLRIGDTQKLLSYYKGALKHFRQLNCRIVAKAFIRFVEPRKQTRHPYNGRKPSDGSAPGATGDPEKTKPEWWPLGVMHKEPDHLRTESRIELLLHIVRKLGSQGITADKLKEVAGDTKRSLKHPSNVEIIYEILRVREMEERFERGEVDANKVVYVMKRGPSSKDDEDEESSDVTLATKKSYHIEQGPLTPTSVKQVSAPRTTPIDTLKPVTSGRSLPGSLLQLESLGFDGTGCQDQPYYAMPPHYTDSCSQPMLSIPVGTKMISPHNISVFDYPAHNAFWISTPNHQLTEATGQYDPWTPAFRHNIFSRVDYSVPTTSPPVVPSSMSYHMPVTLPAQAHGI
ncbi:hypothetical protein NUU61_001589, partial [Penicillium alfredii]